MRPRRHAQAFVRYAVLVVCLTAGLSQRGSVAASASTSSPCAALAKWAEPYREKVPTLDALAAFDRPHRIAIFNVVAPNVRAALVQEHLRRWAREPDLSAEQRALIVEAANLLTPALYDHQNAEEREVWEGFWSHAEPAFASLESKRPWFDLVLSPSRSASTQPARTAGDWPPCECNNLHPTDCNGSCTPGGCTTAPNGCGPGLIYPCNGLCT